VVLGAQWGDEGKGKLVDLITGDMDMVCRSETWFAYFFSLWVFPVFPVLWTRKSFFRIGIQKFYLPDSDSKTKILT
jgi:hypothetical protein